MAKRRRKKPGPKPRLVKIKGDPGPIIDRLLRKGAPPTDRRSKPA
jgi:hypothetical protein